MQTREDQSTDDAAPFIESNPQFLAASLTSDASIKLIQQRLPFQNRKRSLPLLLSCKVLVLIVHRLGTMKSLHAWPPSLLCMVFHMALTS